MWNQSLLIFAESNKDTLNKKIAKHLLELDTDIFETSLVNEAKKLMVAPSTVTKLLRKCGFDGWRMYVSFAYMGLNRKNNKHINPLTIQKTRICEWIDDVYNEKLIQFAKKIIKAKKINLIGHGATKSHLEMFKRNLSILGKNVEILDMSNRYIEYPKSSSIIYIIFSISGKNSFLNIPLSKLKQSDLLGHKAYITASDFFVEDFNTIFNLKNSSTFISKIENAIPIVKVTFIDHILDRLLELIIEEKKDSVYERINKLGLIKRIEK